jgi:hypothetical protein
MTNNNIRSKPGQGLDLCLISLLHDPCGRQLLATRKHIGTLKHLYPQIAVVATTETRTDVIEELRRQEVLFRVTKGNEIGQKRREALALGLQTSALHLHYCDFDRVLHWVGTYPKELENILQEIVQYDFTIIGRTQRAFETHPWVQQEMERITNHVCSLAFGKPIDTTAGSCAALYKTAELILRRSKAPTNATDTEWPMIVKLFSDATIGFLQVEGLEFETLDYYQKEIRSAGSPERWVQLTYESSIEMWYSRMKLALESIEAINTIRESYESGRKAPLGQVG